MKNLSMVTHLAFTGVWLIAGFILSIPSSYAQDSKKEVERRIKKSEMPEAAMSYLTESDWLTDTKRVRYYYEVDGDSDGYEAKVIKNGRHFSIEFNRDGTLVDIEELIEYDQISSDVIEVLDQTFNNDYEKHRIYRVQRQFLPGSFEDDLVDVILSFSASTEQNINYEIEANVKENSRSRTYEFLFDPKGQLLERRLIVRRSLDNLLY